MIYLNTLPEEISRISVTDCSRISKYLFSHFLANLKKLQISDDLSSQLNGIYVPLAASLAAKAKQQQAPPDRWN